MLDVLGRSGYSEMHLYKRLKVDRKLRVSMDKKLLTALEALRHFISKM